MHVVATWHNPKITLPPLLASPQGHTVHAAMLFREHLVQEECDSETENESEGDTPSMHHPHHAAAQAGMTDTLPGMGHVCGTLPGVQVSGGSGVCGTLPGLQALPGHCFSTGGMVAGSTVPEDLGTQQLLMLDSPLIRSRDASPVGVSMSATSRTPKRHSSWTAILGCVTQQKEPRSQESRCSEHLQHQESKSQQQP